MISGVNKSYLININTMNDLPSKWGKDCILKEDIQYFVVLWLLIFIELL